MKVAGARVRLCTDKSEKFIIIECKHRDGIISLTHIVFDDRFFNRGQASNPLERSNVDCDGEVNLTDVVYLINYLFRGGSEPCS